jgi:hypothetical protein
MNDKNKKTYLARGFIGVQVKQILSELRGVDKISRIDVRVCCRRVLLYVGRPFLAEAQQTESTQLFECAQIQMCVCMNVHLNVYI